MTIAIKPRFFAITLSRFNALIEHDLSKSDFRVWTLVELSAKPGYPIPFSLDWMAKKLNLGIATIRRSIRKLVSVGLILGNFDNNRHSLAPASKAFEKIDNRSSVIADQEENRSFVIAEGSQDQEVDKVSADPPKSLSSIDKNKLNACALSKTLSSDWGIYPSVAVGLIVNFGQERVEQVIQWGEHLKSTGKLRSKGWVYRCISLGWSAPDTFHQTRYKGQEGLLDIQPVQRHPQPPQPAKNEPLGYSEKIQTLKKMMDSPFQAGKKLALRLASDWGVDLVGLGLVAS